MFHCTFWLVHICLSFSLVNLTLCSLVVCARARVGFQCCSVVLLQLQGSCLFLFSYLLVCGGSRLWRCVGRVCFSFLFLPCFYCSSLCCSLSLHAPLLPSLNFTAFTYSSLSRSDVRVPFISPLPSYHYFLAHVRFTAHISPMLISVTLRAGVSCNGMFF